MTLSSVTITRREALAGLAAGTAALVLPGCATAQSSSPADPQALLDDIAWNLLNHEPERATSLGVDTGDHAVLRGRL